VLVVVVLAVLMAVVSVVGYGPAIGRLGRRLVSRLIVEHRGWNCGSIDADVFGKVGSKFGRRVVRVRRDGNEYSTLADGQVPMAVAERVAERHPISGIESIE
jgi:hypothetical protein